MRDTKDCSRLFATESGDRALPIREPRFYIHRTTLFATICDEYSRLTSKAIELLYKPVIPPTIFIAYGRKQSSAFALLLEARLQAQGSSVFVDKIIEGGDEWERKIETTIRTQISHFICLLAPGTLDSPNIRNEINWSYESDTVSLRIPIWHSGFEKPDDETLREYGGRIKEFVDVPNALRVTEESAKAYDGEVSLLLNQLQFS